MLRAHVHNKIDCCQRTQSDALAESWSFVQSTDNWVYYALNNFGLTRTFVSLLHNNGLWCIQRAIMKRRRNRAWAKSPLQLTVANQPSTGSWGPHGHVPLACRQDFGGLPVVGRAFRPPYVSKLAFGLDSEYFCFQDLNRPSSHSKPEFLAWAAQTGQMRAIFGGV